LAKDKTNGPAEPDFDQAANIIRGDIMGDREELSKTQGDLSAAWKRVQDACHVNKAAAKEALKILGKSEETRADYLRSLFGMLKAFKIDVAADLVDMAEGKKPGESALLN
jgi:hypothetical protein